MIQENYVEFSTAKLLKEKEFDVSYRSYYTNTGKQMFTGNGYYNNEDYGKLYPDENTCVACPQALVLKWLRVTHGIHVFTDFGVGWGYMIIPVGYSGEGKFPKFTENFKSPEEATEAAILYTSQNLIK